MRIAVAVEMPKAYIKTSKSKAYCKAVRKRAAHKAKR